MRMLAPPAVAHLRGQAAGTFMHRSLSEDIKEEREDLREAAEQTLNVILDLSLDGTIRWVSPSWEDVIGTDLDMVQGKPIRDILLGEDEERDIFTAVVDSMKKDDSRSQIVRFTVKLGPKSRLKLHLDLPEQGEGEDQQEEDVQQDEAAQPSEPTIDLEGQGIMVYDRASGGESHVRVDSLHLAKLKTNLRRLCG